MEGYRWTKVSALCVDGGFDTGPIYLKWPLDISSGTVHDILKKSSNLIFSEMIPQIMAGVEPYEQSWEKVNGAFPRPGQGKVVEFKRSKVRGGADLSSMLDAPAEQVQRTIRALQDDYECGDPRAYVPVSGGRIEFYDAEVVDGRVKSKFYFVENDKD